MANYEEAARTNYFRVKDRAAFDKDFETIPYVEVWNKPGDPQMVAVGADDGWPSYRIIEDDHSSDWYEGEDIDIADVISKHLPEGEVAVVMASGREKLRYVTGYAIAVDHTGRQVTIALNDIYDLAKKEFGVTPTFAEY